MRREIVLAAVLGSACGADETLGPQTGPTAQEDAGSSKTGTKPSSLAEGNLDLCAAAGVLLQTPGLAESFCARQLPAQQGLTEPSAEAQASCNLCSLALGAALGLSRTLSCAGPIDNCDTEQKMLLACASKASDRLSERLTGCDYGTPALSTQQVIQESLLNPSCAIVFITCPAALEALTQLAADGLGGF